MLYLFAIFQHYIVVVVGGGIYRELRCASSAPHAVSRLRVGVGYSMFHFWY